MSDPLSTAHLVWQQLEFSRGYLQSLLVELSDDDWFASPPAMVTHIAWQVGHIAMAEYGLCLFRLRGRQEIDLELMPSAFRKQFSRGSMPTTDRGSYPAPGDILSTLARIHEQVRLELSNFTAEQLNESVDMPYAVHANKLGSLLFAPMHEMLHAGQIGLIRRLLGKPPVR